MRGILAFATISLGLLLATASLQAHHFVFRDLRRQQAHHPAQAPSSRWGGGTSTRTSTWTSRNARRQGA